MINKIDSYPKNAWQAVITATVFMICLGAGAFGSELILQNYRDNTFSDLLEFSILTAGYAFGLMAVRYLAKRKYPQTTVVQTTPLIGYVLTILTVLVLTILVRLILAYAFGTFLDKSTTSLFINNYWLIHFLLVAPIIEEYVFRGYILNGLLQNKSAAYAIVVSALVFGLPHFMIHSLPGAVVFGFFIGWIYYLTRDLILCIIGHSIGNLADAMFWYEWTEASSLIQMLVRDHGIESLLMALILSSLVVALLLFWIKKTIQRKSPGST